MAASGFEQVLHFNLELAEFRIWPLIMQHEKTLMTIFF